MDLTPIIKAVLTSFDDRPGGTLPDLKPGDQLTGRVLRIENDGRVLVDLGGERALAQIGFAVKPGQTLSLQVVSNGPVIHLRADSAGGNQNIKGIQNDSPTLAEPPGDISNLQPGSRFWGSVSQVQDDGRILVDLGASRAWARIDLPVRTGQTLMLEVVKTGPPLQLRADPSTVGSKSARPLPQTDFSQVMSPQDQEQLNRISERLTGRFDMVANKPAIPDDVQNALAQIRSAFESIPAERSLAQLMPWLKSVVEDRGMLFEKRLADAAVENAAPPKNEPSPKTEPPPARLIIARDIKSQLMLLKSYLVQSGEPHPLAEQLDAKEISFLHRSVDRMLAHVEQQQERAVVRWANGESQQVFVHTLPWQDHNQPVQLKVYHPRKERPGGSDRNSRIALLLDMDRLGAVRVDLAMAGEQLQINFFVENAIIQQQVASQVNNVRDSLSGKFKQIQVAVMVSKERIAQFEHEDLSGAVTGRIDLSV